MDSSQELEALRHKYALGNSLALVDSLLLCREQSLPVPDWVRDGLSAHEAQLRMALKPPTQGIAPPGIAALDLGILGFEEVPAGKGKLILAGRRSGEARRRYGVEKDVLIAHAEVVAERGRRPQRGTVQAVARRLDLEGKTVTPQRIGQILKEKGLLPPAHRRR